MCKHRKPVEAMIGIGFESSIFYKPKKCWECGFLVQHRKSKKGFIRNRIQEKDMQ